MTITKYDYDLGRLVYPGATLPSPCPHGWTERCPHCMGGEINRLRAAQSDAPPYFKYAQDISDRGEQPHGPSNEAVADALSLLSDLFSETAHETWTKGEVVEVIEDFAKLRCPDTRPDRGGE